MVTWGGEDNKDRQPGNEGSKTDVLALENAPLSPILPSSGSSRVGHFPCLGSGISFIHLPGAW